MKAEIITIGDEILLGQVIDSNAAFIGDKLASAGVNVIRITSIGDGDRQIIEAVREALGRADLIITTGGLGPTEDDLTKQAICEAFGRELVLHEDLLQLVEERYRRRGIVIPEMVKTQALQPKGATLFSNPLGSAVGILIEEHGKRIISLPGVPQEMMVIMENSVIPYLANLNHGFYVIFRNIQTFGTFESYLAELFKTHNFTHEGCELAYLPSIRGVVLRLTYKGREKEKGEALVLKHVETVKELVGDYYVSDDGRDLIETTANLLKSTGLTVATAESCTGGMIASKLTDISGSSVYFLRGVVVYSNQAKMDLLGVPEEILATKGAVSKETARIMAESIRQSAKADYGISVTGIAGPTGETPDKPMGLVYIALSSDQGTAVHRHIFGRDRQANRERATYYAINYLRLKLMKN